MPKANSWLQEHHDIHLIKCETLEKKVTCVDEVTVDNSMFIPKRRREAIYVKGLRSVCDVIYDVITPCMTYVIILRQRTGDSL